MNWDTIAPTEEISNFVDCFWSVITNDKETHETTVIPDGKIDLIFSIVDDQDIEIFLKGFDTHPKIRVILPNSIFFAVSFKPIAMEYLDILKKNLLVNQGVAIPADFWPLKKADLQDLSRFAVKISEKLRDVACRKIDRRKNLLFDAIHQSFGTAKVDDLAKMSFWSSRQINRYFNRTFGISLKTYCKIFRFKSSLPSLKHGNLYPALNFCDQTHFTKNVKELTGSTPGELFKNKNDRFLLLSAIPKD